MTCKEYEVFSGGDENVLKLLVMIIIQFYEYTKNI